MADMTTWSLGGLQRVASCPACGRGRRDPVAFERHDNESLIRDRWRMVRCADCGSVWLDPRPDAASLPRAYDSYYTHDVESEDVPDHGAGGMAWALIRGYLNRRFGMSRQPANGLGHAVFSLIEPWRLKLDYYGRHLTRKRFPRPGRLLDIGCGNGAFLSRAVDMGWQVMGCEPDPKAAAVCRELGLNVIEGDAFHPGLDGEAFDVVTLSHVIEHVDDQSALLRRVFELLVPGGHLWLACPNAASVGFRTFGAAWNGLHPPYHLCIPSRQIIAGWMVGAGFVDVRFLRRGAHARRLWQISQKIGSREGIAAPSKIALAVCRVVADGLATISSRWAEEYVVMARRPGFPHGG